VTGDAWTSGKLAALSATRAAVEALADESTVAAQTAEAMHELLVSLGQRHGDDGVLAFVASQAVLAGRLARWLADTAGEDVESWLSELEVGTLAAGDRP
jgi:hypothetical protein